VTRTLVAAVLAGAALACAVPAGADLTPPRKTVRVYDNYFLPARLTVDRGTRVTWKWPLDVGDIHDVKLKRGPRGARRFHSDPASAGYRYTRTLKVPGIYRIICTLHEDAPMTMSIRVRE
jgi:plastocyanin